MSLESRQSRRAVVIVAVTTAVVKVKVNVLEADFPMPMVNAHITMASSQERRRGILEM